MWLIATLALGPLGATARAANVQFKQTSAPTGLITASTTFPASGTKVTTVTAGLTVNTYSFVNWTLAGVRVQDTYGQAINPVTFTILEPTNAVAVYLPTAQDTDADGISDWYEKRYFGNLTPTASSDADADGFTLSTEQTRGYHPLFFNTLDEGGLSRRRSALLHFALLGPNQARLTSQSSPAGFFTTVIHVVNKGDTVPLPVVPTKAGGYTFTGWLVDSVRIDNGQQNQPASLVVTDTTVAVARYTLDTDDTDTDGVPDWFEFLHYDTLTHSAASDSDGDGFSLAAELDRGYSPTTVDTFAQGGLSRRRSAQLISPTLGDLYTYRFLSSPSGFVDLQDSVAFGTVVSTPSLLGAVNSGYRFAYWDLDGTIQTDLPTGAALGQLALVVTTDTTATAQFLLETADSDADGIFDWLEYNHYADLSEASDSDTDGDGYDLALEQARGYSPSHRDSFDQGGVSRRRSPDHTIVNLQFFERLGRVLVDGTLTEFFSPDPLVTTGLNFGTQTAPAMGDWDGDGDLDLFIASASGLTVYENIGTKFTLNLSSRSTHFSNLNALCDGISNPVIALGDWSGDGRADLIIGGDTGVLAFVRSSGTFAAGQPSGATFTLDTSNTRAAPACGDFDNDGQPELLVLLANGTVRLYPNKGNSFPFDNSTAVDNLLITPIANGIALGCGDITGDGKPDVVASDVDGRLWEFHANAIGGFTLTSKVWAGSGNGFAPRLAVALADFDADGDVDAFGGTDDGVLVGLRDPRVGRPANLILAAGAQSIILDWDADRQERIKGYNLYRADSAVAPFDRLNPSPIALPHTIDDSVVPGVTYFYQVTGLTEAYLPGNSRPRIVESPPSDTESITAGLVSLAVRPAHANSGNTARFRIAIANPLEIAGTGLEMHLLYDPTLLVPIAQVNSNRETVRKSAISRDLTLTDNGAIANGDLRITGTAGVLNPGEGTLFVITFQVAPDAPPGAVSNLTLDQVILYDTAGHLLAWESTQSGPLTVGAAYSEGDLTGDGVIDDADQALLSDLIEFDARPPTANELSAGDLNADGQLDQDDLVLLKRLLHGKPTE